MKIIITLIIAVLCGATVFLGYTLLTQSQRNQAIDACARFATVTYTTGDGATISEPSREWYQNCLNHKNIQVD